MEKDDNPEIQDGQLPEASPEQKAETQSQIRVGGPTGSKRKLILIIALAVLLLGGAAAYFFFGRGTGQNTANPNVNPQGVDSTFAPRFTEVRGYVSFKDADWYAVGGGVIRIKQGSAPNYYAQREGVPNGLPTSLVAHNDALWLSSQDGLAVLKADQSGFEPVPFTDELSNAELYRDNDSKKLYLSSFEKFYAYDDEAKSWKTEPAGPNTPMNLQSFASNKDFMVASMNGLNMPVWVYSKSGAKWALKKPSGLGDSIPTVFALDGQLFAMGRSTGYMSCEQAGKITATSVFRLDESGQWQPLTVFNADKARPELLLANHVKDPSTVFYASTCGGDSERTKYKVSYQNNTLNLEKTGTVSDKDSGFMGDDGEQQIVVNELSEATGLYPFIRVLAADKNNNLIFGYTKTADRSTTPKIEGLAIAKGSDFTKATTLAIADAKTYHAFAPVVCDGELRYVFAGTFGLEPREGFEDGTWAKTTLLGVNGPATETFADLQKDVSEPRFACGGGKVSWVGKTSIQQLDLATKKITAIGSGLPASTAQSSQSVYPLANGDLWALLTTGQDKNETMATLYHFTSSNQTLQKVGTYPSVGLLAGSATHAWLAESFTENGSDAFQGLAAYDINGTKTAKDVSFLRLGLTDDNVAVVAKVGTKTSSIFIPFSAIAYPLGQSEQVIPPVDVVVRSLRLGFGGGASGGLTNNGGVFDAKHNLMWFSDDLLGSFTVAVP